MGIRSYLGFSEGKRRPPQLPGPRRELEESHHYADRQRFTIQELIRRQNHYEQLRSSLPDTARSMGELAIVVSRLEFEIKAQSFDGHEVIPNWENK